MKYLDRELEKYAGTDMYPFHMPGHKRNMDSKMNPYAIDITEIDGFDNLHHAQGVIAEAQMRAARLYGAKRSFYLVNGSTCGILAAISSTVTKGGQILLARNSHKAAYHAVYLRNLQPVYLYPIITHLGIQGCVSPEVVQAELEKNSKIQAVFITSPTYEGITSDIRKIAEIAHSHGIPLIVDEAHGAHFGFDSYFPETAVRQGADLVIQSMHKTLPSFTQTALIHVASDRIDVDKLQQFLGIYETSSPSYVFMAGMDRCVRLLEEKSEELFSKYREKLEDFYKKSQSLKNVEVLDLRQLSKDECSRWDPSKLVLRATGAGLDGKQLYDRLREQFHLELEMCSGDYALAMTSFMDTQEAFDRLYEALIKIDELTQNQTEVKKCQKSDDGQFDFIEKIYQKNPYAMSISEATDAVQKWCLLDEAEGQVSGDYVFLYPPGIPLIVPGEVITSQFVAGIHECVSRNLNLMGVEDMRIKIVNSARIHYTRVG